MALIKCPECGKEISEYASHCVGCGCPMDRIRHLISNVSETKTSVYKIKSTAYLLSSEKEKTLINKICDYITENTQLIFIEYSKNFGYRKKGHSKMVIMFKISGNSPVIAFRGTKSKFPTKRFRICEQKIDEVKNMILNMFADNGDKKILQTKVRPDNFTSTRNKSDNYIIHEFEEKILSIFDELFINDGSYMYTFRIPDGENKFVICWFANGENNKLAFKYHPKPFDKGSQEVVFPSSADVNKLVYIIQNIYFPKPKNGLNNKDSKKAPPVTVDKMSIFDSLRNKCNHKCNDVDIKIPALTKKHNYECAPGPFRVCYCPKCKTYYIDDEDFKIAKGYGFLLVQYKPNEATNKGPGYGKHNGDLAIESILKRSGYTVDSRSDLSDEQRVKILNTIIEAKLISQDRVCDYIKWFIRMNENSPSMESAVYKWKKDLDCIQEK